MNGDVLQKIIRIIKLLRTHDNDQEAEKFEMVSALEAELAKPEQSKYSDIVSDGGFDPRNKFDAQPEIDYPPECKTHEEKLAYAAGWWKALEVQRQQALDKKAANARELGLDYEVEPFEYWNAVEGWVQIDEIRQTQGEKHMSKKLKANENANKKQVGGNHYKQMGVEPWDVIDTWPFEQRVGAYRAGALKYIMRCGSKDQEAQEIGKGIHYLEKLLEVLKERS